MPKEGLDFFLDFFPEAKNIIVIILWFGIVEVRLILTDFSP